MLRSTRILLLLAIVLVVGAVGTLYFRQRSSAAGNPVAAPKPLPLNTDATATDWTWSDGRSVTVRAKRFRLANDPQRVELEDVELRISQNGGEQYDLIRSASAQFDPIAETMYSDGEVEITKSVPAGGLPVGRLLKIRSSGVTYDRKGGRVSTNRAAEFTFDAGDGFCVGASYDPALGDIIMKSQVRLDWRGGGPSSRPMRIEAGELIYKERDSYVDLHPWSRLTRDNAVVEGGAALIKLEGGAIRRVEAKSAHGVDNLPRRNLQYAADRLYIDFTPKGAIEKVNAEDNARLVSTTPASRSTVTGDAIAMDFDIQGSDSQLSRALARGNSRMESVPLARPGASRPETRRLMSDVLLLTMRPGGREVESVVTQAPGTLEFLPNAPGQRRRTLQAAGMTILYGADNTMQSFNASDVATRTDPDPARPGGAVAETWSKRLAAEFAPATGRLTKIEQGGDFRYKEGDRQARADRATLEEARDLITLDRAARVWDSTGSTSADRIVLNQRSRDVLAEGHVVSTRLPDKAGNSSPMLSHDEPLEATADRMRTARGNRSIHYEGRAVAWQGANRIWADNIDIDRDARRLSAEGHVKTQFVDRGNAPDAGERKTPPAFVVVEAAALVYTEADRLAHYSGGAHLMRAGMDVRASEIRAWLSASGSPASSLERANADGNVIIVRVEPDRKLTGTSEHAEYTVADQRILLTGGKPTLVDSLRGFTTGRELIYYANNDKLLVNGVEQEPVKTVLRRRR
jgi:lipopolysaccharide export system protein LptA